jgi:hypothetical protein
MNVIQNFFTRGKNRDAVDMLKDAIRRIEQGEIKDVGISWVHRNGSVGGDVSEGSNDVLMSMSLIHTERSFYNSVINRKKGEE